MKVMLDLTQEQVDRLNTLLYMGAGYARRDLERSDEWWNLTDSLLDAWDYKTRNITGIDE